MKTQHIVFGLLLIVFVAAASASNSMLRKLKVENKNKSNATVLVNFTSGSTTNQTARSGKTLKIESNKSGKNSYDYISAYSITLNSSSSSSLNVTSPGSSKEAKYKIEKNGTITKKWYVHNAFGVKENLYLLSTGKMFVLWKLRVRSDRLRCPFGLTDTIRAECWKSLEFSKCLIKLLFLYNKICNPFFLCLVLCPKHKIMNVWVVDVVFYFRWARK